MSFLKAAVLLFLAITAVRSWSQPVNGLSSDDIFLPQGLPQMNVLVNNGPSDGNMYLCGVDMNGRYLAITDKNGTVQKAIQKKQPQMDADFRPNPNGTYSYFSGAANAFIILDTNFLAIDTVVAPIGYQIDYREIRFTSESDRLIIANDTEVIDMRKYIAGGDSMTTVVVPSIFKLDKHNSVLWTWRSIDHFKVTDATQELLTASFIDFCHMNAIEFDADSNLLISSRNMDEITKIDRKTGNIIWRWGGKNNQFLLVGDTLPFSHQHAIRRTPEGTYTMFDNGNYGSQSPHSRAIEYRLDTLSHTATKIWEFRHNPDILAIAMGYVERLPNKNTFIGWGQNTNIAVTEVDPGNNTVFEMAMAPGSYSYRAYKFDTNYIRRGLQQESVNSEPVGTIHLKVFPNPITDAAKIDCDIPTEGYGDLSLFDCLGREVLNIYSGYLPVGKHEYVLNLMNMRAGVYYLRARYPGIQNEHLKVMILN